MKVLFVDDEQNILDGLKRMLRKFRGEWEMEFALGPREALTVLEQGPVDVVVSDMRMPEQSGVEMLEATQRLCPKAARIILSGHSQRELAIRSASVAHQFLAKPCDAESLRRAILRSARLRELLTNEALCERIGSIGTLPTLPEVYTRVSHELAKEDPSLNKIAEVVNSDAGMSVKILQLVNSAFFGIARTIQSIEQAVVMLGADVIESLVLTSSAFSQFETKARHFSAERVWRHSLRVGAMAAAIADCEGLDKSQRATIAQAAMLHDIGKLILATQIAEQYDDMLAAGPVSPAEAMNFEREALGCTHPQVGAYLLGLWGFADGVVEAVAFHHEPGLAGTREFTPLTAVYLANELDNAAQPDTPEFRETLDGQYLQTLGAADKLENWISAALKTKDTE